MKRPILVVVIGYIFGIIVGLYFNMSVVPFCISMIIFIYFIQKSDFRYLRYIKLFISKKVIVVIIVSSVISNSIVIYKNNQYKTLYKNNQNIELVGNIESDCTELQFYNRYTIKIKNPKKYKNSRLFILVSKNLNFKYGDKVSVKGIYKEINDQYLNYYKTLNIYGSLKISNLKVIKENNINVVLRSAHILRQKLEYKINSLLKEDQAAILNGILLGDTKDIDEELKDDFRISGISHILAVSGMHVGYITLIVQGIFIKLLGKKNGRIFSICIIIFYAFIVGFSPSTVRATFMAVIGILSKNFYRKNDTLSSIFLSLLCILFYNPYLIMSSSLQFSFLGTLGIVVLNENVKDILNFFSVKNSNVKNIISITISVQLVVLPVIIVNYNIIGIYSLITNLLISVLIAPILFCALLLICFGKLIVPIESLLLKLLISISKIGKLPFAYVLVPNLGIFEIIFYYILLILFFFFYDIYNNNNQSAFVRRVRNLVALFRYKIYKKRKFVYKFVILIVIVVCIVKLAIPKNLNVNFIDVGQGDSTFIVTPTNKTILIDGGEDDISSFILKKGYTKIDIVIISHFDSDHVRTEY